MKATCVLRKPHPKCRPPNDHRPIVRLRDDHRWVNDNGDPGLAFVGPTEDGDAVVYVAFCTCKDYLNCPVSRALAFCSRRYGAATVIRRRASRKPKQDRVRRRKRR